MKRWAPLVRGITDWTCVLAIQDRGSPRMHMVLWTGRSAEDLIQDENIVCARTPDPSDTVYPSVIRHQIYTYNDRYCKNGDPTADCRFGYQKAHQTSFIENDKSFYKRGFRDQNVNTYCPFLLSMFKCNMNIQVNTGCAAMHYLAKYLTKAEQDTDFSVVPNSFRPQQVDIQDHLKARIVGSVEVSYMLLGLHMNESSRTVVFIAINLPTEDIRTICTDIQDIAENSTEISHDSLVTRYEQREVATNIALVEFVQFYYEVTTSKETWRSQCNIKNTPPFYDKELPVAIKSCNRSVYRLAQRKKRFWRTRFISPSADSESYYYQQILIHYPIFGKTFEEAKNEMMQTLARTTTSWKEFFVYLVLYTLIM